MRQSILHNVDNLITALSVRLSSLRSQESTLTANIVANPDKEKELTWIERELKTKEALYLYLLQQREENELARNVASTNFRVITPPTGSTAPFKPSKRKMFLAALIIGMAIPFGVITGWDVLNITVRNKNDMAQLPVPTLGVVPLAKKKSDKRGMLFVQDRGRDALNESFRIVRTNLELHCMQNNIKVIQFTSMESGSGKTFTSLNLAMSFALAGKKVALIDLDLRTAALSKYIDYQELGVSVTLNKLEVDDHFHVEKDYFHPGFDIIPAGPVPVNPSDLLTGENLKTLINGLRKTYDYIFIDVMHIGAVADAVIVGQIADLTVVVLRENYTNRRKLAEISTFSNSEKFKSICAILNCSNDQQFYKQSN
jgi:capsular exopolysaccharide synthesis family protein